MKVNEVSARKMFAEMGYKEAKWNAKRLTTKLNSLPSLLSDAKDVGGDSLKLIKRISTALSDGDVIALASTEGVEEQPNEAAPVKKRGRPKGSTNKGGRKPKKPKARKKQQPEFTVLFG